MSLSDGSFVVAWRTNGPAAKPVVRVQRFAPDGTPGPQVDVTDPQMFGNGVRLASAGDYAVGSALQCTERWMSQSCDVLIFRVNQQGAVTTTAIVTDSPESSYGVASVAGWPDGTVIALSGRVAFVLDGSDTLTGDPMVVGSVEALTTAFVPYAGGVMLGFDELHMPGGLYSVHAQRLTKGGALGSYLDVSDQAGDDARVAGLAVAPDGSAIVRWGTGEDSGSDHPYGRSRSIAPTDQMGAITTPTVPGTTITDYSPEGVGLITWEQPQGGQLVGARFRLVPPGGAPGPVFILGVGADGCEPSRGAFESDGTVRFLSQDDSNGGLCEQSLSRGGSVLSPLTYPAGVETKLSWTGWPAAVSAGNGSTYVIAFAAYAGYPGVRVLGVDGRGPAGGGPVGGGPAGPGGSGGPAGGVPGGSGVGDRDGDGVPDNADRCPGKAAATATGCPRLALSVGKVITKGRAIRVSVVSPSGGRVTVSLLRNGKTVAKISNKMSAQRRKLFKIERPLKIRPGKFTVRIRYTGPAGPKTVNRRVTARVTFDAGVRPR
ncbi:MAG: hypothetical protein AB7I08_08795 [Thermoleophilia bacterium]